MTAEVSRPAGTLGEWLSNLPLAASAGSVVSNLYEGSKNYNCITQYALGTVESSVKLAASAISPVVKTLDKPSKLVISLYLGSVTDWCCFIFIAVQAVDSYTVSKLIQLEEKVPAVKSQPEEVVAYLSDARDALAGKIVEGRTSVYTHISGSKDSLISCIATGKEAVYSKLSSGADVLVNSQAGIAMSERKQAIASHIAQGKEVVGKTISSGRDAVFVKIQSGMDSLANTKAGCLVGSGIDQTLTATENWVEYLLPEKELLVEGENESSVLGLQQPSDENPAEDETTGRVERICSLSQKVKLRMYNRSLQKLQAMQKNCKSTLEQLKQAVDLVSDTSLFSHVVSDHLARTCD